MKSHLGSRFHVTFPGSETLGRSVHLSDIDNAPVAAGVTDTEAGR